LTRNVYEGMFLLDSGKVGGDWNSAQKLVHGILERNQAEIITSRPWDERRLAYPVSGHKKGMYYLTYFRLEGPKLSQIEQDCRINESVLRQLILKVHPKLVEQLVAQAMTVQQPPSHAPTETESDDEPAGTARPARSEQ
jgi:small subunit ribosomal protein S6